jgi:hypothetical protein
VQGAALNQVLPILLQHPELSRHLNAVCSLAQTSKALQEALQQSSAGTVRIDIGDLKKETAGAAVQSIAAWISKYPGLLGELELDIPYAYEYEERSAPEAVAFCCDAEAAITAAFQRAAATTNEGNTASTTAAAAAAVKADKQQQLRLTSFRCDLYSSAALVESLYAPSLTYLSLSHPADDSEASANQPCVAAALARLTALKRLDLRERNWLAGRASTCIVPDGVNASEYGKLTNACLSAIGSLRGLTWLSIGCTAPGADLGLLPRQLLELHLTAMCSSSSSSSGSSSSEAMVVSLGHLVRLQELHLTVHGTPAAGSSLPTLPQLLTVCVAAVDSRDSTDEQETSDVDSRHEQEQEQEQEFGHVEQLHITALQQLQQLRLSGGCGERPAGVALEKYVPA